MISAEEKQRLDERRKAIKAERMKEKMLRMPVNDVILQVQDGTIELKDVFERIELKVKEGLNNGRK
jgi:hypothetical protein